MRIRLQTKGDKLIFTEETEDYFSVPTSCRSLILVQTKKSLDVDLHTTHLMDISLSHLSPDTQRSKVWARRAGKRRKRLHTPAGPLRANKGHVTLLRAEPL